MRKIIGAKGMLCNRVRSAMGLSDTHRSRRELLHAIHFHSTVLLYLEGKKNDWLLVGSILYPLDTNAPYQPVALPLSHFTRSKILRVWRHMISSVLTLFPSMSCVIKSSPVFAEVNCWAEREGRWILSTKKKILWKNIYDNLNLCWQLWIMGLEVA